MHIETLLSTMVRYVPIYNYLSDIYTVLKTSELIQQVRKEIFFKYIRFGVINRLR